MTKRKGWYGESQRHSAAAKGIKTGRKIRTPTKVYRIDTSEYPEYYNLLEKARQSYGRLNAWGGYEAGNYGYKASDIDYPSDDEESSYNQFDDAGDFLYASPERVEEIESFEPGDGSYITKNFIEGYHGESDSMYSIDITVPDYSEGYLFEGDYVDDAWDYILWSKRRFGKVEDPNDVRHFTKLLEKDGILSKVDLKDSGLMA